MVALSGCGKSSDPTSAPAAGQSAARTDASGAGATPIPGTPVRVAPAERRTLPIVISGSGRTVAFAEQKLRAPFAGTLTELRVSDGDRVNAGQVVGRIVSRDSEAALSGAREMMRQARTPAERTDAERALALAERSLVSAPLRASTDGAVLSRAANAGDRVAEDAEILSIEDARSIAFVADFSQGEVGRVAPGQRASVEVSGRESGLPASVRAVLPAANPADFTAPVRVDFRGDVGRLSAGLFGTARVTVGERRDVLVVPDAAAIRDDITGITRVATIREGKLHWVSIERGIQQSGVTEVSSDELSAGENVIVSGQIGLAEGAPVFIAS